MPIADLVSQGSTTYVAAMERLGHTEHEILAFLRARYVGEAEATYRAAYRRGVESMNAANLLQHGPADEPLLASEVQRHPTGRTGWGYLVYVLWRDPASGAEEARTVLIHSDRSLSRTELQAQAFAAAEWQRRTAEARGRSPPIDETWVTSGIDIVSVLRE